MQTMNISLPEPLKAFVDAQIAAGRYSSVSEYVRELIRADQKRREEEKLEALLLHRLQGDTGLEFDIEDVRAELAKRLTKKK